MLSYGTGICCHAFVQYYFFIASIHSFFCNSSLKSGIDKSTEWSKIPACPSLMCFFAFFFKRGNTEGTNFSKMLCLTFVYVLFYVNLCQD